MMYMCGEGVWDNSKVAANGCTDDRCNGVKGSQPASSCYTRQLLRRLFVGDARSGLGGGCKGRMCMEVHRVVYFSDVTYFHVIRIP